jgi:effector-binding domain-containing protein
MNSTKIPEVLLETRGPQAIVSLRQTVAVSNLQMAQLESLRLLWEFTQRWQVEPAGAPFVRYHTFGSDETDVEVGIPVVSEVSSRQPVLASELPGGPTAVTMHVGAHDGLAAAYRRLQGWISDHARASAGAGWEVYGWIDLRQQPDPTSWPPPTEWRTQLVQPLIP